MVREHQRRRILLAALDVFAVHGFAAATVKDLIGKAHVSRATFYEIFADKEACMADLYDEIVAWLRAEATAAIAAASGWEAQVRTAVETTVGLLGQDRRLAAVCALEARTIRAPEVRARQERVVEELTVALRAGRAGSRRGEELPKILEPALIWGALYLAGRLAVEGGAPDPSTLGSELAELILLPYRD